MDLFVLFLIDKRGDSWLWMVYANADAANAHRDHIKQAVATPGRAHFGLKSMGMVDAFVMKHSRGIRSHFVERCPGCGDPVADTDYSVRMVVEATDTCPHCGSRNTADQGCEPPLQECHDCGGVWGTLGRDPHGCVMCERRVAVRAEGGE